MPKRKSKQNTNKLFQKRDSHQILVNFWTNRLIEISDNQQLLYQLIKDPTNPIKLTPEELTEILNELQKRVETGEISATIYNRIVSIASQ